MILRNVQLTSLVGTLAATIILPLACSSEFEGCKASRTCQPGSQGGEGGENGDTAGTSGSGGNTNGGDAAGGSSGAAGMAGAGDGGTGGSGDDTERPTVVSMTPEDGDVDIERNVTITVELSEPIDEGTVTSTSVTLTGPNGEVSGTVSVDGNVVVFAPERALNLLGTYTFAFDDTIADLAGNTLAESARAEFRVRDGRLSEPVFPFGTVPREVRAFGRNALGDVVVGMNAPTGNSSVYGATYRALDGTWTRAAELRSMTGAQLYAQSAGIDSLGRAVVTWYPFSGTGGWSRFSEGGNWADAGALPRNATASVSPGGTTIGYWADAYNLYTQILDLSDGTLSAAVPSPFDEEFRTQIVWSFERAALFARGDGEVVSDLTVQWKLPSGWSAPEPLATGMFNGYAIDADEEGNIIVVWWTDEGETWSRVYQRGRDQWLPAAFLASGAFVNKVDMTAGSAIVSYITGAADPGSWAAIYRADVGWVASSIVKLDAQAVGSAVALDGAGNALVAWHSEGKVRRYVSGSGWQPEWTLGASSSSLLWAAAAADGSVLVVSSEADGSTVGAPFAVRFE